MFVAVFVFSDKNEWWVSDQLIGIVHVFKLVLVNVSFARIQTAANNLFHTGFTSEFYTKIDNFWSV